VFSRKFTDVIFNYEFSVLRCEVTRECVDSKVSLVGESGWQFNFSTPPAKSARFTLPDHLESFILASVVLQEQGKVQDNGKDSDDAPNEPSVSSTNVCARPEPERKGEGYNTGAHWQQTVREPLTLPKVSAGMSWIATEYRTPEGQQVTGGGKHECTENHDKDGFWFDHHMPRVSLRGLTSYATPAFVVSIATGCLVSS
jgi:hypothetical protein